MKILTWDKGGIVLIYKRLERGQFKLPHMDPSTMAVEIEGPRRPADTDTPGEEAIVDQIAQGIRNEVCDYFDFDYEDRTA